MKKHWSEVLSCSCGKRFRTSIEEARHRHNFPALCRKPKPRKHEPAMVRVMRERYGDAK